MTRKPPGLGARPQAQPGRAAQAREGAARDPRRAAGADRARLRERRRGGRRPPPVVGPLPRQAEDRHVHAARQGPAGQLSPPSCARSARSRTSTARATASSRPARTSSCTGSSSAKLPDVFAHLERPGVTTAGGCGDTVRNITGCPVQGIAAAELFDASPVVDAAADLFYGNPDWANLPRKHKYSISACADRCNAPEINCISLIGTVHDGREGFAVLVGGGLSSVPRIARDMGVFVPKEEANEILGAITSVWSEDLKYRVSRVKARLKFMVDDIGAGGNPRARRGAARPEARGLRAAADRRRAVAPPRRPRAEAGRALLHRRPGASRADLGRPDDRDRRPRRALRRRHPPDAPAELHRHRHPERERRRGDRRARARSASRSTSTRCAANSIACTGEPHCNFSVAETKTRLGALIDRSTSASGRRSPTCGCISTAARTPARSTGSATSASRARPRATRAACAGRPTTSSCAAASGPSRRSAARSSAACRPTSSTARSKA